MEFEILYDHIVQASGHVKFIVYSHNGVDRILMWIYFNYIVVHSKYLLEGVHTVITDSRDEGGFIVSLSQVCYKIINHPEQTQGARSDSDRARHSRIFKRRYNVREEGEESGGGF